MIWKTPFWIVISMNLHQINSTSTRLWLQLEVFENWHSRHHGIPQPDRFQVIELVGIKKVIDFANFPDLLNSPVDIGAAKNAWPLWCHCRLSKSAKACIYAIFRNIWLAYFHLVFCPNHPINQYFSNSPRHGTRTGTRTGSWEGQDGQDVIVQYWQDVDAQGGQDDQGKEGARPKALESGKLVDIKTSDPKPIIW